MSLIAPRTGAAKNWHNAYNDVRMPTNHAISSRWFGLTYWPTIKGRTGTISPIPKTERNAVIRIKRKGLLLKIILYTVLYCIALEA